jgi:16S rRNA (cytidine1402-2'-O)-methyltransferase
MSGTLYVVATPIGNLEDVTLRALRVLRETDLIAAEDTRRTAKLLAHHGISIPTISFHTHNARTRIPQLISRLLAGESIALVSDAGTPGVSDPGEDLVRACIQAHVPIDPVPGPSAPLAAVVASGFPVLPLTILGFAPHRSKDRTAWFRAISEMDCTITFFESPLRIAAALKEAGPILGNRQIVVAREVTKMHQEFLRGTCLEVAERMSKARGEITVVISPNAADDVASTTPPEDQEVVAEFVAITKSGVASRRAAVAHVATKFKMASRDVYAIVERAKNGPTDQ